MGRTVPTFTMVLQQEIDSWGKFRRGLRREDQEALDELFRAAGATFALDHATLRGAVALIMNALEELDRQPV